MGSCCRHLQTTSIRHHSACFTTHLRHTLPEVSRGSSKAVASPNDQCDGHREHGEQNHLRFATCCNCPRLSKQQIAATHIINYHQLSSIIINYHQLSSIIINYHQLSSIIINYHQLSSIIIMSCRVPSCPITSIHF